MFSAVSKVDRKGRISIPIGLRAKMNLLEGSDVKISLKRNRIFIEPMESEEYLNVASNRRSRLI